jgi:GNAT superfamily N-acetyltransferase
LIARPLQTAEAAVLGAVCATIDPYLTLGLSATGLAGYLDRDEPALHRFALETGDAALAGVLVLRLPWLRGPFIEMMAVLPGHQGAGIGAAVMAWAAAQAAVVSPNLWATVSDFNQAARAFYTRHGFIETVALPGLVDDRFAEILLRRRLA